MNDRLFVIGIGGTGMRCLESFVHLCAMGMFDGQEINILTIDTDTGNGNKDRTENLITLYNEIKSATTGNDRGGVATKDSFFTAKLNLYKFATDYSGNRVSYRNLANISDDDIDNQDLADLFLDKDTVQNFNLSHGYRAQTHLGSMLMYTGIVEAARNAYSKGDDNILPQEKALKDFVEKLLAAGANARVFIFGSVFGGTGASSIPVVPRALNEAVRIISNGTNTLNPDDVKFGAALLTDYFSFRSPNSSQLTEERVVADSRNFALNSQAALDFYRKDPTVKAYYRRLYHIGWPQAMRRDISEGKLLTGGGEQKNPCHVVELMSAMAAYDFFTQKELPVNTNEDNMPCYYRTVEQTDDGHFLKFSAESFYRTDNPHNPFFEKMAQMFSLSNLVLASHGAAHALNTSNNYYGLRGLIQRLKEGSKNEVPFVKIDPSQLGKVENFLRNFSFRYSDNGKKELVPGWLYQIRHSVDGGRFIFRNDAFISSPSQYSNMANTPGNIFDGDNANKNWDGGNSQYNKFIDSIKNSISVNSSVGGTSEMDQFLGFLYAGIRKAHKFN